MCHIYILLAITMLSFSRDGMNCFKVRNESDVSVCGDTKVKRWAGGKRFHGWVWVQSVSSRGGHFSKWRWERRLRQWPSGRSSLQTVRTSLEEAQVGGDLQVPGKQWELEMGVHCALAGSPVEIIGSDHREWGGMFLMGSRQEKFMILFLRGAWGRQAKMESVQVGRNNPGWGWWKLGPGTKKRSEGCWQ